jgi:hypothetical protein
MSGGVIHMSGVPGCPDCGGRGVVPDQTPRNPPIPRVVACECTLVRDIAMNVERGWRGLMSAPRIPETPLMEIADEGDHAWITAEGRPFRAHMRHVAVRMGRHWRFKVVSDADLLTAWLATAAAEGAKIIDPDLAARMAPVSTMAITLVDLVDPPELLVVVLGVKAARNSAMPEVLAEAITLRTHSGKPLWILDQPSRPLCEGHRAWSQEVTGLLGDAQRIKLEGAPSLTPAEDLVEAESPQRSRRTLSGSSTGGARAVELPQNEPKKGKKGKGRRR